MTVTDKKLTLDNLLNGKIKLHQPAEGYRVAIDPIFLSASVNANANDLVLDLGAGVGAAAFCLSKRTGCRVVGLEVQKEMIRLANENSKLNDLLGQVEFVHGDLNAPPPRLAPSTFDHVMVNPPYYGKTTHTSSNLGSKSLSNMLENPERDLKSWIHFSCLMVKPGGTVTFIFPAHLMDRLIWLLYGKVGQLKIFPLWIKHNREANRILIRGKKNLAGPTQLCQGLILHDANSKFTPEAEAILRNGDALTF